MNTTGDRIDSMVETDTHVFILEFKVDKSGRVASNRDFNAVYAAFRRRVSQGFEQWGFLTRCTQRSGAEFRRVSSSGYRARYV